MSDDKQKMKNKLSDVNNLTLEMIERLMDEDISSEELEQEIKRGETVAKLVGKSIDICRLSLDAKKLQLEYEVTNDESLNMLEMKNGK